MSAAGGRAVRLTSHPAHELASVWSPDGSRIAFEADRDGYRNTLDALTPLELENHSKEAVAAAKQRKPPEPSEWDWTDQKRLGASAGVQHLTLTGDRVVFVSRGRAGSVMVVGSENNGAMPELILPQTPEAQSCNDDEQLRAAVAELLGRIDAVG